MPEKFGIGPFQLITAIYAAAQQNHTKQTCKMCWLAPKCVHSGKWSKGICKMSTPNVDTQRNVNESHDFRCEFNKKLIALLPLMKSGFTTSIQSRKFIVRSGNIEALHHYACLCSTPRRVRLWPYFLGRQENFY